MKLFEYTTGDIPSLEALLKTSFKIGLTDEQVRAYRKEYGFNEIPENVPGWWHFLFAQLKSPFLIVLMVAAFLSFLLGDHDTSIMIAIIVLLNTVVGFYQEYRADRSVRLLKNMIPQLVVVRRNGKDHQIPTPELVPGDIVVVESGSIISADIRFFVADNVMVDESMLTGEAQAVLKHTEPLALPAEDLTQASNIGYAGTLVVGGRGLGVVVKIGRDTVQGSLGVVAGSIENESVFSQEIARFTKVLLWFIGIIFIGFVAIHFIWGRTDVDFFHIILFIVALAISITPEGLPVVVLFSLSRSARALAKEHVIVKRLSAVNDLGSIQVLCVDKTGTLTQNSMTVAEWRSYDEGQLFLYAALACERPHIEHRGSHSLDDALWVMFAHEEEQHALLKKSFEQSSVVQVIPFDPVKRSNEIIVDFDGQRVHIMRGACESVVERCGLSPDHDECSWAVNQGLLGRRVLGVAINNEQGWRLIGFISFTDPLKPTVKKVLEEAAILKVQVKLITGDAAEVAGVIAQEAGIISCKKEVVLGRTLRDLPEEELAAVVDRCNVFARVAPEEKYLIIRALQKKYSVGFLGDGINDVLAIKAAHVGIVVQGCTDIAREAADIVLLKKSLASIVHGIRVGREGVVNIKKYVVESLGSNLGSFCAIAVSSLFVDYLPLAPVQILLLNFITDFTMLGFAGDNVDPDELSKPAFFDIPWLLILVIVFGLLSAIADFSMFYLFSHRSLAYMQTHWAIGSVCTELVFIYSIRTKRLLWRATRPSTLLVILTVFTALLIFIVPNTGFGQRYFEFIQPSWHGIRQIFVVMALFFVAIECVKIPLYRWKDQIKKIFGIIEPQTLKDEL